MGWLSRHESTLLSILRIVAGLLLLEHGTQKLFHFPPMTMAIPANAMPIIMVAAVIELVDRFILDLARKSAVHGKLVSVLDEGHGIADASNLFVPFFTTKPQGTGIGLALSRQIAELHQGTLSLENRGDHAGARARLRLPLRPG